MVDVSLDLIISLATTVITMAMNVKANKERCQRVAKRVTSLQELVLKLKERDPSHISDLVRKTLNELSATLVIARNKMQKYHQCNIVKSFIFSSANKDTFLKINERLDDTFQILSGALQIQHGDVLNQVLNAVTGKNPGVSNMRAPTPAITVTHAPNPPYPPAQRPAYNPNTLLVPMISATVPCSMPPRVVSIPAPPATVHPIMHQVYGTLPPSVPSVIYAQATPPHQVIMTVPPPRQVVTVVMTRPF